QTLTSDLRSDLRHLELLKTWPVKPAAVIRGEMLWPGLIVTLCAWCALGCAAAFSAAAFPEWPAVARLSTAVAAMLVAPSFVFAQFAGRTGAAVLFPGWVPLGDQRPRGLDAIGQRLILFAGVALTLLVVVGPGAVGAAVVWLLLYRVGGVLIAVPAAAIGSLI